MLEQKIKATEKIIMEAVANHGNTLYLAYSGGKDSRVLLHITRRLYPSMLVIHNEHPGETPGDVDGMLTVRAPKSNVPGFLKFVKLEAQMDGTRRDEDKTVQFDGKEIHRRDMPDYYSEQGLFGLHTWYPLIDWTQKEIDTYVETLL